MAAASPSRISSIRTHDSARHVGDEPLLLAEHGPVAVTPDRAAGATLLMERGCDFLIMDDGFQSARIHMDYALLVVDGRYGVGNGHVIPGGPLAGAADRPAALRHGIAEDGRGHGGRRRRSAWPRAPASRSSRRDAAAQGRPVGRHAASSPLPASAIPRSSSIRYAGRRRGRRWRARFRTIISIPTDELDELAATAQTAELELITTAKDAARLRHGAAPQDLARQARRAGNRCRVRRRAAATHHRSARSTPGARRRLAEPCGQRLARRSRSRRVISAPAAQLRIGFDLALQRHRGVEIGFLPRDAPVFEFVERDRFAGHRTAHEGAGAGHLEIAVEIADAGLPGAGAFETVHHGRFATNSSAVKFRHRSSGASQDRCARLQRRPNSRSMSASFSSI